jgi:hypothetical protein
MKESQLNSMFCGIYTTDLVDLKHTHQTREAAWGSSERGPLPGTALQILRAGYHKQKGCRNSGLPLSCMSRA